MSTAFAAGGLQYTGQQLGSSLGVALIGAIVLTGLTSAFVTTIQADPRISAQVSAQVGVAVENGIDFVSGNQVQAAAENAGLDQPTNPTTPALVDDYGKAQLGSLKVGLFTAALLALMSTRNSHTTHRPGRKKEEDPALFPSSP